MNEIKLTPTQKKLIIKRLSDLKIQAMMFDMGLDIETWSLIEKNTYKEPDWLRRWNEKRNAADNDAGSPEQAWA